MEMLTSGTEPGHDKLVSSLIQGLTLLYPPWPRPHKSYLEAFKRGFSEKGNLFAF